jgi:UDP-glucose 4-epimerase/GDP-4-dehydro-6-deoxy-D-mannose reductase
MIAANGLSGTIGRHLEPHVEEIKIDLSAKKEEFSNLELRNISQLIHLAGIVGEGKVLADPVRSYSINVDGLTHLAEEFYKSSSGKFIYISSSHVYAPSNIPLSEESITRPINKYAEQKLIAETQLSRIFSQSPHRLTIIRVFSVLDFDVPDFTLGGAIRRIATEGSESNLENVDDIRDFMTPKAIAKAILEICKLPSTPRIVNLCTGEGRTVKDAAMTLCESKGVEFPAHRLISGNSSIPSIVGDNSLLRSLCPELRLTWITD